MHQKKAHTKRSCTDFKQAENERLPAARSQQQKKLPKHLLSMILKHISQHQKTGKAHALHSAPPVRFSGTVLFDLPLCSWESGL